MAFHGIDISSYQGAGTRNTAMSGQTFAIVKATESTGYVDPSHAVHVSWLRANGHRVGHYHYGHPSMPAGKQVAHFLKHAAPRPGEVLALDLEDAQGAWSQRVTFALDFLAAVKTATGAPCWLYANGYWLTELRKAAAPAQWQQLTTYPLWVAAWNGKPGDVSAYGWPVVTCHQYADHPLTDRDYFTGTGDAWYALAVPKPQHAAPPAPPKPKPTPPAHVSVPVPGLAAPVTITLEPKK